MGVNNNSEGQRQIKTNPIGKVSLNPQQKSFEKDQELLLAELIKDREDLAALTAVTANAISTLELDELLDVLLKRIVSVMHADIGVILLKYVENKLSIFKETKSTIPQETLFYPEDSSKNSQEFLLVQAIGLGDEISSNTCISDPSFCSIIGETFAGLIASTMTPLYIANAQTDPRISSELIKQKGIRSILGVPLKRNKNLIGVLYVGWFNEHPCEKRQLHLLEITAERCAMAIINAQLYEETKQLQ